LIVRFSFIFKRFFSLFTMKMHLGNIRITLLLAIVAAFIVVDVSCNTDKCKTIICSNGSYCNMGSCICTAGYEGVSCSTPSRDKFVGNWMVYEKGSASFGAQYPISIVADSNIITDVWIYNFYDYFKAPILATISNFTITIPNQQLEGKTIFGKGYIYTPDGVTYDQYGAISMSYEVIDSATGQINDFGYNSLVDNSKSSAWNK
jgi:hypothetical protein